MDVSYLIIRSLALVGLAWKVRLPAPEALAAKRQRGVETQGGHGHAERAGAA